MQALPRTPTPRSAAISPLWRLLRLGLTAYLLLAGAMYVFQDQLIYLPSSSVLATPERMGLDYQDVWIDTDDGERLHAWWLPAAEPSAPVVLFLHGNAGNISHRLQTARVLHAAVVNVLLLDYRGYGQSSGSPDADGLARDALAAWRYLVETRGIAPARIAVHGRSLGAAVALGLTRQVRPGAVVVEAAFTGLPALAAELYPWLPARWLTRSAYPNRELIAALDVPVLVLHGRDDRLIGFHHGQALAAAAPPGTRLVALDGGHNDAFLVSEARYLSELSVFLHQFLQRPG